MRILTAGGVLWASCAALLACSREEPPADGAATPAPPAAASSCPDRDPERRVFFGDLHVHTARSMDAYIFAARATPDDAYRFARGEPLRLAPFEADGRGTRPVQLARPLDFAAVTDHSEFFGGVQLCAAADSPQRAGELCQEYLEPFDPRATGSLAASVREIGRRMDLLKSAEHCGADGAACRSAAGEVWREMQASAARWLEPCRFTTFVAYEYSPIPEFTKLHRNVIFRGDSVPVLPISSLDEPSAAGLWRRLRRECDEAGRGCESLAIPHNPNLSNGQMFAVEAGGSRESRAELARLRAAVEPLLEMMQMKGDSECASGMWQVMGSDELCEFEKLRVNPTPPDCEGGTGKGALIGEGCASRLDFARYALLEGLRQEAELGVNPYKPGFIASTDIHDGTPGRVDEWAVDAIGARARPAPGMNPGGLAAIWAEENTRDALFAAMRRRETYATSGPRITARFFGGWDYPEDLCADPDWIRRGYSGGVPMGGDLPAAGAPGTRPVFAVSALRDPGTPEHPGGLLQRIQIVKAWVSDDGTFQQRVHDVAGDPDAAAGVDPQTCAPHGPGAESLCAVWRDPEFDPGQRVFYYARILENPSCRHTAWACATLAAAERPAWCSDPGVPATIQERAWTSPIWYTPPVRRAVE
jgi:hypothetical protein